MFLDGFVNYFLSDNPDVGAACLRECAQTTEQYVANRLRPVHHPRRCPFQMRLVGTRTMLGNRNGVPMAARTQVRSHALTLVKDLNDQEI